MCSRIEEELKKIRKLQEVREREVGECEIEAEKIRRRRSRKRCCEKLENVEMKQ